MEFTKMHGAGNDYIVMNCMQYSPEDPVGLARNLSDRHFGVGGDGLICICPSEKVEFRMRMFNADGSEGAMCGNGIRCAARYAFEKGLTDKREIRFETPAGIRSVHLYLEQGEIISLKADMGVAEIQGTIDISVKGKNYTGTAVLVGNLHFVVPVPNVDEFDVQSAGAGIESDRIFPDGVNVEFVKVVNREEILARVWERGSGETLSCGTGACAVAAVMTAMGLTNSGVSVRMPGGVLAVSRCEENHHLLLQGPAVTVFEGRI